ncbi:MAG: hypothetical protein NT099_02030 [Candidatus Saganbacteria bacterium]|nr:hypothetical protein [Candidatus Saganbacteria bacterium]
MSSFELLGGGGTARLRYELQKHSPVTTLLRDSMLSNWSEIAFQVGQRLTFGKKGLPAFVSDQLHQAGLRLASPDVLEIPSSGIHVGGGIWIRRVMPESLGEVSRPYFEHVRLFEILGPRIKGEPGLHAFIGVHSMMAVNGRPWCIGGTRMRGDYASVDEAARDVLRLSRAMTYKCAAAGIPIGGGKCDIMFDPKSPHRDLVIKQFALALEYLKVIFTGQDMNISPRDAVNMALVAQHSIIGPSDLSMGGIPPTPPTAKGVFLAIKKAAELKGIAMDKLAIALQGLGGVGGNLIPYLLEAGVKIVATDAKPETRAAMKEKFGGKISVLDNPDDIYAVKADVFSPCAREDVLNDDTIPRIIAAGVKLVIGAANNPLRDDVKHAEMLRDAGILYFRDFVVNGGGLMGVASGVMRFDPMQRVETISRSTERLHQFMTREGLTGHEAGERLAEEQLAQWNRFAQFGWQGPEVG